MEKTIIEILRERKAQELQRSRNGSEYNEQRVRNNANYIKQVLRGSEDSQNLDFNIKILKDSYYNQLRDYTNKVKSYSPLKMNKRSISFWSRVEKARAQTDCTPEQFIKAQFVWFHKRFGCAPSLEQLATESAVERAKSYNNSHIGRVVSNNIEADIDMMAIFKRCEMLLQEMMTAQKCSRKEFYKKFVITGEMNFPEEFLSADPEYKKALNGE